MQKRDSAWRKLLRGLVITGLLVVAVVVVIVVRPDPVTFLAALGLILVIMCFTYAAWPKFKIWLRTIGSEHNSK